MTVTEIIKNKNHLATLLLSNGQEVEIDKDICAENGICSGFEIEPEDLKKLITVSEKYRAKQRALWYLDQMDYSEKKLFEKLTKAGFSQKISAEVMANLCESGIVDDRRFAFRLAERMKESNISKRDAVNKLYLKGIPLAIAKEVTEGFDGCEQEQIRALLEGKYRSRLEQENGTEKVFAALARKGFSFAAIKSEMKKYSEELEFEEEF